LIPRGTQLNPIKDLATTPFRGRYCRAADRIQLGSIGSREFGAPLLLEVGNGFRMPLDVAVPPQLTKPGRKFYSAWLGVAPHALADAAAGAFIAATPLAIAVSFFWFLNNCAKYAWG
jgi:hypothetical protein